MSITKTESSTGSLKNSSPLPKHILLCLWDYLHRMTIVLVTQQHTMQNEMRDNCRDRGDRSRPTLACKVTELPGAGPLTSENEKSNLTILFPLLLGLHFFSFTGLTLPRKQNTKSQTNQKTSPRVQHKFRKWSSEVDNSFSICEKKKQQQKPLCINSKAAVHLHVMSQTTRDNRTLGTRILPD